jgi:hypothetical protein
MRMNWRILRITGLSLAVGATAIAVVTDAVADRSVATHVGDATVALGEDTARSIERVAYRQDVVRVGDVVIVDGAPRTPPSHPDVAAMWEMVDGIWPEWLAGELRQLSVVEEVPRGLVGVVHPAGAGGWILSLDVADIDDVVLVRETIVHELSHVVSLDRDGFSFGDDGDCVGVRISLGCAFDGTVLADFSRTFWPGDERSHDDDDFVNDYARTGAHEDLAETFTAWVLGWPVDGDVIDAKIDLMASDPDLDRLATSLREMLAGATP